MNIKLLTLAVTLALLPLPTHALQLKGQVEGADHPDWIPAYAVTNDNMTTELRSGRNINKGAKNPISPKGQKGLLLRSKTQYWHIKDYPECTIWCNPIHEHPGNFYFWTIDDTSIGPRGWLQDTGTVGEHGGRVYRFWFDKVGGNY